MKQIKLKQKVKIINISTFWLFLLFLFCKKKNWCVCVCVCLSNEERKRQKNYEGKSKRHSREVVSGSSLGINPMKAFKNWLPSYIHHNHHNHNHKTLNLNKNDVISCIVNKIDQAQAVSLGVLLHLPTQQRNADQRYHCTFSNSYYEHCFVQGFLFRHMIEIGFV